MSDAGWFSYSPRYVITFPGMSTTEPDEHVYTFTGAPPVAMTLHLNVVGGSLQDEEWRQVWSALQTRRTAVRVEIEDADGLTLCKADGQLTDGWVPSGARVSNAPGSEHNFWHRACRDIPLSSAKTYRLHLGVEALGGSSTVDLVPILEGGGRDSL